MASGNVRIGWLAALSLVLLRLALGWHFYSEGAKKLDGTFSSAGFLSGANGPYKDYFRSLVPIPHDWQNKLLVRPVNDLTPDAKADPLADGEAFTNDKAYAAWGNQIVADWNEMVSDLTSLEGVSEEQAAAATAAVGKQIEILGSYLEGIEGDIEDYQHEYHDRLAELKKKAPQGTLPYNDDRIADKEQEIRRMAWGWVNDVEAQERAFTAELAEIVANEKMTVTEAIPEIDALLHPQGDLDRVNLAVTCVTIGAGALLMLGLFTRVAALAAGAFLVSVMITQPPWDPAVTDSAKLYFGYQLAEVAALLVTAMIGTGRWLGLDGVLVKLIFGRRSEK